MTTSLLNYKNFFLIIFSICIYISANAQTKSTHLKHIPTDTTKQTLSMDAAYNRPLISAGKLPIAIGGYLEANTQYASTDGASDGLSFQFRRLSVFISSTIARKIKFNSEIEFTPHEINIEYASMDIEFHPLLNFRGGIILNPIGSFNQNHDGPRWDFIDRPISSTTILPATLSNVGFGLFGKHVSNQWILGYEVYLTNGFDDQIISNTDNRTSLADGKINIEKFEQSNSGLPMFTGKLAFRNRKMGEVGISYMSGVFNQWKVDGTIVDRKRGVKAVAIDFNTSLIKNRLNITTEVAKVFVDVPESYTEQFGSKQFGGFVDIAGTIIQHKMFDWKNAKINLAVRLEYADYNQDIFKETGGNIADDIWAIVPGISFRPVGTTVLRFNYRYQQQRDLLGNAPAKTGMIQFGFSTYF
ncbi:MAG TPA: hypothetical protein VE978_20585 [Chitinophagales bacterium]|nr:hypothetical protein [Chitinophagales bacterium]